MDEKSFNVMDYALKSYVEQYKDLTDTWKTLDAKAQGSATIAGIFLAAAFAWSRDPASVSAIQHKHALELAIVLLAVSVAFAVWALIVKEIAYPPFGKTIYGMAKDLERAGVSDDRVRNLKNDEIGIWIRTTDGMLVATQSKARRVRVSHLALLAAAAVFTYLTCSVIG